MTTAPLKVLLLGWDTPAAPVEASATGAATPDLIAALAPHTTLTLLLPHLPAPMHLSSGVQATGLSDLSTAELALTDRQFSAARLATWQSPSAPYVGNGGSDGYASSAEVPAAPYASSPAGFPVAPPAAQQPEAEQPAATQAPTLLNPDEFAAETAEPDALEAGALNQPADDLQPDTAPEPSATSAPGSAAGEFPVPVVQQSVLDVALGALRTEPADEAGLNFKVIQYARFATRVASSQDFAVIYASDWQSWLAGMEIRQLTGKPLVLHVHSLAQDRPGAADRGWIVELERMALRRADLVLTASATLAMRLLELHELAPQRVRRLSAADMQNPEQLSETILTTLREAAPARNQPNGY